MKDTRCRTALQELHNEHVLVPADKVSNNIIKVCKKHYTEVIGNELAGKTGKASTRGYILENEFLEAGERTHAQCEYDVMQLLPYT